MLTSIRGKALAGGKILCATDGGLLTLKLDQASREIVDGTLFTDTEPFVSADVDILAGPGGSIYVVTTKQIVQLTLGPPAGAASKGA